MPPRQPAPPELPTPNSPGVKPAVDARHAVQFRPLSTLLPDDYSEEHVGAADLQPNQSNTAQKINPPSPILASPSSDGSEISLNNEILLTPLSKRTSAIISLIESRQRESLSSPTVSKNSQGVAAKKRSSRLGSYAENSSSNQKKLSLLIEKYREDESDSEASSDNDIRNEKVSIPVISSVQRPIRSTSLNYQLPDNNRTVFRPLSTALESVFGDEEDFPESNDSTHANNNGNREVSPQKSPASSKTSSKLSSKSPTRSSKQVGSEESATIAAPAINSTVHFDLDAAKKNDLKRVSVLESPVESKDAVPDRKKFRPLSTALEYFVADNDAASSQLSDRSVSKNSEMESYSKPRSGNSKPTSPSLSSGSSESVARERDESSKNKMQKSPVSSSGEHFSDREPQMQLAWESSRMQSFNAHREQVARSTANPRISIMTQNISNSSNSDSLENFLAPADLKCIDLMEDKDKSRVSVLEQQSASERHQDDIVNLNYGKESCRLSSLEPESKPAKFRPLAGMIDINESLQEFESAEKLSPISSGSHERLSEAGSRSPSPKNGFTSPLKAVALLSFDQSKHIYEDQTAAKAYGGENHTAALSEEAEADFRHSKRLSALERVKAVFHSPSDSEVSEESVELNLDDSEILNHRVSVLEPVKEKPFRPISTLADTDEEAAFLSRDTKQNSSKKKQIESNNSASAVEVILLSPSKKESSQFATENQKTFRPISTLIDYDFNEEINAKQISVGSQKLDAISRLKSIFSSPEDSDNDEKSYEINLTVEKNQNSGRVSILDESLATKSELGNVVIEMNAEEQNFSSRNQIEVNESNENLDNRNATSIKNRTVSTMRNLLDNLVDNESTSNAPSVNLETDSSKNRASILDIDEHTKKFRPLSTLIDFESEEGGPEVNDEESLDSELSEEYLSHQIQTHAKNFTLAAETEKSRVSMLETVEDQATVHSS